MKKKFLFSLGLLMSWLTLSSFTDGPDNLENQVNGHEYVDLGLPSGIKWATCNVGASTPEECGGYYAWGETEEKENYSWITYKWCNGSSNTMTKYCANSSYGTVDNKTVLDPKDDVAHVKWGGTWRMPTADEIQELLDNCTWTWTARNGVNGYRVTGSNGNSIFLPAVGQRLRGRADSRDRSGLYWSSSLFDGVNTRAYFLFFSSACHNCQDRIARDFGRSVRPVCE